MKTAHVTVVPLQCPRCERFFDIGVTLLDEPFGEASYTIPEHCRCGEPLDTPQIRSDVLDTAAQLMQDGD